MEIVHLILGKANPNRMNGVNKFVNQLASKQKEQGRKVSIWGISVDLSRNFEERDFETKIFKREPGSFSINVELQIALKTKQNKTVFHLHGGWVPLNYALAMFLKKNNIAFVITPHGAYNTVAMNRNKWFKKIYFQLFEKRMLNAAHKIHSIGKSEAEGLQKIYKNNQSFLMPYGFEFNEKLKEIKKPEDKFIVGFIGRIDIQTKGLDILVKGFSSFQRIHENAELWIIGADGEIDTLKALVQSEKVENVKFLGSKFGNDKLELIQQMHTFVHTSRNEGLPASILEVAFFGVPCIVSNETNFGEKINEYQSGITLKENNSAQLYKALAILYVAWQNNSLNLYSENAKNMIAKDYSWNVLVKKYDALYS
jgi:glycosyltransferase involved in cell wall biosynthesis